jgi:ribosomal protein S18 acetylase RimI-like enzyme
MRIEKYLGADESLSAALKELIEACSEHDGHKTAIDIDASLNAVQDMHCVYTYEEGGLKALLSLFAPGRDEIEVNALVHPDYRNKGLFRALLKEAVNECARFGYDKGLLVCGGLGSGRRVMEHWGCGIDHVELQMSYQIKGSIEREKIGIEISEAHECDIEELSDVGAAAFGRDGSFEREFLKNALEAANRTQYMAKKGGRIAGLCAAMEDEGKLLIFGLGVHPGERRKGYAQAMLRHIEKEAVKRGIYKLGLDVDEDNPSAIALYKSFGFSVIGRTEYYSFEFGNFI